MEFGGITRNYAGFGGITRDYAGFGGITRDLAGLRGITRDLAGLAGLAGLGVAPRLSKIVLSTTKPQSNVSVDTSWVIRSRCDRYCEDWFR